MAEGSIWTGCA